MRLQNNLVIANDIVIEFKRSFQLVDSTARPYTMIQRIRRLPMRIAINLSVTSIRVFLYILGRGWSLFCGSISRIFETPQLKELGSPLQIVTSFVLIWFHVTYQIIKNSARITLFCIFYFKCYLFYVLCFLRWFRTFLDVEPTVFSLEDTLIFLLECFLAPLNYTAHLIGAIYEIYHGTSIGPSWRQRLYLRHFPNFCEQ